MGIDHGLRHLAVVVGKEIQAPISRGIDKARKSGVVVDHNMTTTEMVGRNMTTTEMVGRNITTTEMVDRNMTTTEMAVAVGHMTGIRGAL